MSKENKNGLLSLIDIAFAEENAKDKYGMKIGDHKLLCNVLDAHMKVVDETSKKINEEFSKSLLKDIVDYLDIKFNPLEKKIENISISITELKKDIFDTGERLNVLKTENEEIHQELKNGINELKRDNSRKAIYTRVLFTILISVAIALILGLFIFVWYHNKYLVGLSPLSGLLKAISAIGT